MTVTVPVSEYDPDPKLPGKTKVKLVQPRPCMTTVCEKFVTCPLLSARQMVNVPVALEADVFVNVTNMGVSVTATPAGTLAVTCTGIALWKFGATGCATRLLVEFGSTNINPGVGKFVDVPEFAETINENVSTATPPGVMELVHVTFPLWITPDALITFIPAGRG